MSGSLDILVLKKNYSNVSGFEKNNNNNMIVEFGGVKLTRKSRKSKKLSKFQNKLESKNLLKNKNLLKINTKQARQIFQTPNTKRHLNYL